MSLTERPALAPTLVYSNGGTHETGPSKRSTKKAIGATLSGLAGAACQKPGPVLQRTFASTDHSKQLVIELATLDSQTSTNPCTLPVCTCASVLNGGFHLVSRLQWRQFDSRGILPLCDVCVNV